jgi:hypothetical protein
LLGTAIGAIVPAFVSGKVQARQRKTEWKREALLEQLNGLYRELYLQCCIIPDQHPEHYFSEWESQEFTDWLDMAIKLILPKLHLAHDQIVEKLYYWREIAADPGQVAEPSVRELYKHIDSHFKYLRKELCISD